MASEFSPTLFKVHTHNFRKWDVVLLLDGVLKNTDTSYSQVPFKNKIVIRINLETVRVTSIKNFICQITKVYLFCIRTSNR